ncbi:Nucleolar protein 6 [Desmophyllum pertusum]|uniref:Nucleolar protein 6 n=1 Tax=Desmophyllum pertusum TaxID=174260 RepID=A0A9W9ZNB8_9CNID|nr:Nucleolar protein 6 [Desmophyllum pertusum]
MPMGRKHFLTLPCSCHDVYGGDLIGVVRKPHSFAPTQFKVLRAQSKMPFTNPQRLKRLVAKYTMNSVYFVKSPNKSRGWVIPNVSAILSDFQTIGEGLVKKIEALNA